MVSSCCFGRCSGAELAYLDPRDGIFFQVLTYIYRPWIWHTRGYFLFGELNGKNRLQAATDAYSKSGHRNQSKAISNGLYSAAQRHEAS
jgi:hypothetical protein